jgi:hypothetical protein
MTDEKKIDPALAKQIAALSEQVHDLLNGEDGRGQLTGEMEMQRVTLHVPRAFVMLATFMAMFEPEENRPNSFWQHDCDEGRDIDHRIARMLMRRHLGRVLYHAMHEELHWLVTHWFLSKPDRLLTPIAIHMPAEAYDENGNLK